MAVLIVALIATFSMSGCKNTTLAGTASAATTNTTNAGTATAAVTTSTTNAGTSAAVISAAGYVGNIAEKALGNSFFREVVFTGKYSQLVVMSLKPGEEIGTETHPNVDQFFRVEKGSAKVIINGVESLAPDGTGIVVPAGSEHNIINSSTSSDLKLYTIYSPPNHKDGVIHKTKIDAEADTTDIVGSPYITN